MDWSQCPDVERLPGKVSGAWIVKGTRVPADAIVDNAAEGFSPEEIAADIFEGVPLDRIRAVLRFSGHPPPHSPPFSVTTASFGDPV